MVRPLVLQVDDPFYERMRTLLEARSREERREALLELARHWGMSERCADCDEEVIMSLGTCFDLDSQDERAGLLQDTKPKT